MNNDNDFIPTPRFFDRRSRRAFLMILLSFDPLSYKARPLNGIWATAPYLHNGSVPSLWQLLQPSARRDQVFHEGSYEFDPLHVGFESGPETGGSSFDTRLPGNTNSGHDYGVKLSDSQKWELLE